MDDGKFYQRVKEIGGVAYTAQFNGLSAALRMLNESHDKNGNFDFLAATRFVLDNVIVEPRCSVDDFGDIGTLNEVVAFGREVAQGMFRTPQE